MRWRETPRLVRDIYWFVYLPTLVDGNETQGYGRNVGYALDGLICIRTCNCSGHKNLKIPYLDPSAAGTGYAGYAFSSSLEAFLVLFNFPLGYPGSGFSRLELAAMTDLICGSNI